jgi:hypothetical protein
MSTRSGVCSLVHDFRHDPRELLREDQAVVEQAQKDLDFKRLILLNLTNSINPDLIRPSPPLSVLIAHVMSEVPLHGDNSNSTPRDAIR